MKNNYFLSIAAALFVFENTVMSQCLDQTAGPVSTSVICNGSGTISLGSSETGVNYYVRNDANNAVVTGPVAGSGTALLLGSGHVNSSTIFNIYAKKNTGALQFDGIDDYVDLSGTMNSNSNFTWEAWIKANGDGTIFSKTAATGSWTSGGKSLYLSGGHITFEVYGVGSVSTYNTYNDNNWHHVAITCEMNYLVTTVDRLRIYIDGVFLAEKNNWDVQANLEGGLINRIGYTNSDFPAVSNFKGTLEDLKIWSVAKTATDVVSDMTGCLNGTETSLVGYFPFEDGSGTMLTDVAGNDNNGTLMNMTNSNWAWGRDDCGSCSVQLTQKPAFVITAIADQSLAPQSQTLCSTVQSAINAVNSDLGVNYYLRDNSTYSLITGPFAGTGGSIAISTGIVANTTTYNVLANRLSGGLAFDGTDDYVMMNENATLENLGLAPFTIETWVYPTNSSGMRTIVRRDGDYSLYLNNGTVVAEVFPGGGGGGALYQATSTNSLQLNKWAHVAAVWDGTNMSLYTNGITATATINNLTSTVTSKFSIGGAMPAGQNFEGRIDELRIWNTTQSVSQLTANIASCLTGTESGLIAYYQFEDGKGSAMLTDKTVNANNGTLSNMDNVSAWKGGAENCGCSLTFSQRPAITVNLSPTVSVSSGSICSGDSFVINPSGADAYTVTGGSFTVSPATTVNYSVTGSNSLGCVSLPAIVEITVNTTPTIAVTGASVCSGNYVAITPAGADNYTITGTNFTVSPLITTDYSVTGSSTAGCAAGNTAVATITVNATPTLNVNSGTVCSGQVFTITPGGADTFTISGGSFTVMPSGNTGYSVTGTSSAGCMASNTVVSSVSVDITPTLSVPDPTVCAGNSVVLAPEGASTYTITGNTFTVTPFSTTSYSITGTGTNACVPDMVVATVYVNDAPTVTVNSGSICAGELFTITPAGASAYTISGGNFVVSPVSNASYSVTGTSTAGCSSMSAAVAMVTVNATPTISVNNGAVCPGNSFTLMPSGGTNYTYSGGSEVVTPNITTTYTVTGSSAAGCVAGNTAVATVSVVNTLTVTVSGDLSLCEGQSTTLTANGATTYSWSSSSVSNMVVLAPASTTIYTVTGSSGNCSSATVVTVLVSTTPTIAVNSGSVCAGSAFVIQPSGADNYTISGGSATVSPVSNSSYTVMGSSGPGCVGSNTVISTVSVASLPAVAAASSNSAICLGESAILAASGASMYTWSDAQTGGSITVAPPVTTTYTVTGTASNGCVNTATVLQKVDNCTAIEEISNELIFGIYPNPNTGQFVVDAKTEVTITIADAMGQVVYTEKTVQDRTAINIAHLDNGIYFVKAEQGGSRHTTKIVKE